jgi:hypothetical protein
VRIAKPKPFWNIQEIRKHHGSFRKLVSRWLLTIDHAYCALGHHAVPSNAMNGHSASTVHSRCNACNNAHQLARYHAPDGKLKAYNKKYQAEHPEVAARATKVWRQRHPDKAKEKGQKHSRKRWQQIKADPVKHAAFLARAQEAYKRRTQSPIEREKMSAASREKYLQRKEKLASPQSRPTK